MTSDNDLDTATAAIGQWVSGAADGDWTGLLALLDPDVRFHVPVAGYGGVQRGVVAAARFFGQLADELRAELTPSAPLCGDGRVAFEVAVRGVWLGRPFAQGLCVVFAVRDGRVHEFGEYLAWPGGLEPGEHPSEERR